MLKPLRVNFESASVPPTTAVFALPFLISLAPNIMLFNEDEQAVLMVVISPLNPHCSAIISVLLPA